MEIWKEIKGYSDYEVSSHGRVKSLKRNKEKILVGGIKKGYRQVILCGDKLKYASVHVLVAIHFHGHVPNGMIDVINHKDFNRLNNHSDNLEITTSRKNANKKHLPSVSKYTGVYWHKATNKDCS